MKQTFTASVPLVHFHVRVSRETSERLSSWLIGILKLGDLHEFFGSGPRPPDLFWKRFAVQASRADELIMYLKQWGVEEVDEHDE